MINYKVNRICYIMKKIILIVGSIEMYALARKKTFLFQRTLAFV